MKGWEENLDEKQYHIRPFATARRAWLFADTPKGAEANAVLYTFVEIARVGLCISEQSGTAG